MNETRANTIHSEFLHVRDGGKTDVLPVTERFWEDLAEGGYPQLSQGRLMSCFTFSEPWPVWERHPAGEELVMLVSGSTELLLEGPDGERAVRLQTPGDYVLVPAGVWHTARTRTSATLVFLTPGAGTEHRPV